MGVCVVRLVEMRTFAGIMIGLPFVCILLIYLSGHRHAMILGIDDIGRGADFLSTTTTEESRAAAPGPPWMTGQGFSNRTLRGTGIVSREGIQQTHTIINDEEEEDPRGGDERVVAVSVNDASAPLPLDMTGTAEAGSDDQQLEHSDRDISNMEAAADGDNEQYHGVFMRMRLRYWHNDTTSGSSSVRQHRQQNGQEVETEAATTDDDDDTQSMVSAVSNISADTDHDYGRGQVNHPLRQHSPATVPAARDGEDNTILTQPPSLSGYHHRQASSPRLDRVLMAAQLESQFSSSSSAGAGGGAEAAPIGVSSAVAQYPSSCSSPLTPITPLTPRSQRTRDMDNDNGLTAASASR